jgi:hypothetical protein
VGEYIFLFGKGNENHELGTGFLCIRESYQQLGGLSLLVIGCHKRSLVSYNVLNVHVPTEDKTDDVKYSFYEELERVFDKSPKYHIQILLRDSNAKVGREDIFKPTIGNESFARN